MKKIFNLFVLVTLLALTFGAAGVTPAQALAGTYFTTTDNENNAHTGSADGDMDVEVWNDDVFEPVEFNISVPAGGLPATDSFLAIRAFDVDEEQGQKDEVFLNGTSLGFLSGTDGTWNTSPFEIPAGLLVEGNNLVNIEVDTLNPGDPSWLVVVDWGQIVVDGGIGTPGRINSITVTGFSVAGGSITLDVNVEIEALANGTFTLETNIYDPTSSNVDADTQTGIAMTAGQILTRPVQFVFPAGANGDIYTIRGFLFDEATGLLNSIKSTTWTYSPNTAPVADDDAYNTPMGTLLNGATVLTGDTDADSDPLTAIQVTGPSHAASFSFYSDGTFAYTPANGFSGDDTFTYKANDGTADSNVATVTITVTIIQYTVTFDGNGSTGGSMVPQASSVPANLTLNAFTWPGHAFAGWGTTPGGPVVYADNAVYDFASDITLYAQWTPRLEPLSPSGTLVGIPNPTFTWSILPTATSYRLAVYSLAETSYLILDTVATSYCNASQCSYPSPINLTNGDYKFKVLAYLPGGTTPYSDWMNFTITGLVIPPPVNPPTPLAPTGTVANHRPTFQWSSVEYAAFYRLGVLNIATNTYTILQNLYVSCVADVCSYTPTTDLPNGNYRFKILARNDAGFTAYSTWMNFTVSDVVVPPPANPPTPIAPTGTVATNRPTFKWSSVEYAAFYRLGVLNTATNTYTILLNVYPTCAAGVCSYTPTIDLPNGNYRFKVLARNDSGYTAYSNWMNFTVP